MKMWLFIFVICLGLKHSFGCRGRPNIPRPGRYILPNITQLVVSNWSSAFEYIDNDTLKEWIAKWGTPNETRFDSAEEGRDPESGWPAYWKGLGAANKGVPPPPWAKIPLSYGKPQFCFIQPGKGKCNETLVRWAYNPTINKCQTFRYTGCGGNQNNFINREDCQDACVKVPDTGCEAQEKINFEELTYQ